MTGELDRETFLRLLDGLGSASDEEALAAAREVHAQVGGAGLTWDALLVPEEQPEPEAADDEAEDDEAEDDEAKDDEAVDDEAEDDDEEDRDEYDETEDDEEEDRDQAPHIPDIPDVPDVKDAVALKLIERLLEKSGLLEETRDELREYKKDIAAGEFEAMDRRYLKALHVRLAKRK